MKKRMRFMMAKEEYKKYGIDVDEAIETARNFPISMHCWQGDDVKGFERDSELTGGIQVTGNYVGRARNIFELKEDISLVLKLVPGQKRLNLHAMYADFSEGVKDRDSIGPENFKSWVEYAREKGIGLDFNPTLFSHPMADRLSLSSEDRDVRGFWIEHCKRSIKIADYFAKELSSFSLLNIWIPDGMKDTPGNRLHPRKIFMESLDEILSTPYNKQQVYISLESKVFGIGLESYTVGSSEFTTNYALSRKIVPLMDNGHYHPTEQVSDKISSMLLFHDKIALHLTRAVRWDSDHVVLFDDETRAIMNEVFQSERHNDVMLGLDFFDASINRVAAWVTGMRNAQKAVLYATLQPNDTFNELQKNNELTKLLVLREEIKTLPFNEIWNEYCRIQEVPTGMQWYEQIETYEKEVLRKRQENE